MLRILSWQSVMKEKYLKSDSSNFAAYPCFSKALNQVCTVASMKLIDKLDTPSRIPDQKYLRRRYFLNWAQGFHVKCEKLRIDFYQGVTAAEIKGMVTCKSMSPSWRQWCQVEASFCRPKRTRQWLVIVYCYSNCSQTASTKLYLNMKRAKWLMS